MDIGFGEHLRTLRAGAGLTIEALAEAAGLSPRAISDTERGRSRVPQPRTVAALAAALRLDPAQRDAFAALARAGRDPQAATGRPRTCELPRPGGPFVGRVAELDAIGRQLAAVPAGGPGVAVVVHGPPGVGKTALAVRAAEEHRDRYPGGVFHLDLRDGDLRNGARPAQATLLKALGVPAARIARDEDERAGQVRAVLWHRRCLLLLDDAADEAQVRGLLPGAGANAVLVTSRRALGGLEAVHRLGLAPFAPAESAALLHAAAAGHDGTPAQVEAVARLCGHLPLALHIAGTRLHSRPGWSMAVLAERLADADQRLALLSAPGSGVRAAFLVSYAQLAGPVRAVFRRLAEVPAVSFGPAEAALVAPCPVAEAEEHLEELLDLGLLEPDGDRQYRFHDLIRLFAAERLRAEEPPAAPDGPARRSA
ncbi:helix-turn-helix domain-containing protein [Dactylosporangium sp. CS-033363]|uniref:helix-turn-helix domain-containing protein n=1 Tax=Dactylosporangium sp. CS-033363 TaxID=3239935 RepID=UPI003D94D892